MGIHNFKAISVNVPTTSAGEVDVKYIVIDSSAMLHSYMCIIRKNQLSRYRHTATGDHAIFLNTVTIAQEASLQFYNYINDWVNKVQKLYPNLVEIMFLHDPRYHGGWTMSDELTIRNGVTIVDDPIANQYIKSTELNSVMLKADEQRRRKEAATAYDVNTDEKSKAKLVRDKFISLGQTLYSADQSDNMREAIGTILDAYHADRTEPTGPLDNYDNVHRQFTDMFAHYQQDPYEESGFNVELMKIVVCLLRKRDRPFVIRMGICDVEADFGICGYVKDRCVKGNVRAMSLDTDYFALLAKYPNTWVSNLKPYANMFKVDTIWNDILGDNCSYDMIIRASCLLGNDYVHNIIGTSTLSELRLMFNIDNKFNENLQRLHGTTVIKKCFSQIVGVDGIKTMFTPGVLDAVIASAGTKLIEGGRTDYMYKYCHAVVIMRNHDRFDTWVEIDYNMEPIVKDLANALKTRFGLLLNYNKDKCTIQSVVGNDWIDYCNTGVPFEMTMRREGLNDLLHTVEISDLVSSFMNIVYIIK